MGNEKKENRIMNFESKNFMQFDLPFTLDSLALVDIVDSSVDVKENDIVFISTKNEEECQKFVEESIKKKAGYIFTYLNLKLGYENVFNVKDFDGLLASLSAFKYPQYKEKNTFYLEVKTLKGAQKKFLLFVNEKN